MKITWLRDETGKKIDTTRADNLGAQLINQLAAAGFITDNIGLQKIGMHNKCFVVDTNILGYNKSVGRWNNSVVGFTRTNIPTWEQRVQFNNIINKFFDDNGLTAKIISGDFLIRCHKTGAKTDWSVQRYDSYRYNEISTLTPYDIERAKNIRRDIAKEKRKTKKRELMFPPLTIVAN